MPEPLTTQLVAELMTTLLAAFPSRNVSGNNVAYTAEIYRDGLTGLSGDAVRHAVKRSIQEDTYFPKVARLRELATSWERHNRVQMPEQLTASGDDLWCRTCQQRATWRELWVPMVDDVCRPLLSACAKYVLLRRTERLLCHCAAKPAFAPKEGVSPPAAEISHLAREAFLRSTKSTTTVTVESSDAA